MSLATSLSSHELPLRYLRLGCLCKLALLHKWGLASKWFLYFDDSVAAWASEQTLTRLGAKTWGKMTAACSPKLAKGLHATKTGPFEP
eukprot:125422-Amphidinium_carterae.1